MAEPRLGAAYIDPQGRLTPEGMALLTSQSRRIAALEAAVAALTARVAALEP